VTRWGMARGVRKGGNSCISTAVFSAVSTAVSTVSIAVFSAVSTTVSSSCV